MAFAKDSLSWAKIGEKMLHNLLESSRLKGVSKKYETKY